MAGPLTVIGPKTPLRDRRQKAVRVHQMWMDFDRIREPWARDTAQEEDFFLGDQWTKRQIFELGEKGMAPLVINRTMPVIQQEISMLTARPPQFRALPRDDSDVKMAAMWSDILSYVTYISDGEIEIQQAARDYCVMGAAYLQVYVDHLADDGRGEVKYHSLPIWDVWVDPMSRKLDLSDARAIIVSRQIAEDALIFMYPEKKDFIRKAASSEAGNQFGRPQVNPAQSSSGVRMDSYEYYPSHLGSSRTVRLIECYEKIMIPYIRVSHLRTGQVVSMPADQWNGVLDSPAFHVEGFYRNRIRLTQTIGSTDLLHEVILPTGHYPIIPFFMHHTRTPFPKGDVAVIKGLQQEINKRRSVNIHNAMLAGNFKISAEDGSIANEEDYNTKGTQPGFIFKHRKGFNPPVPWYPQALPNAWFQMESEGKADIEYALGVFAYMMGSNADAPETYRGLLALEEAGQRKMQLKSRNFNAGIKKLGLVVMDYCQALYTRPKLIRITGEDRQEIRDIWINKATVDVQSGELKTENSISVGRYDLVVAEGATMPTNRMALLNLYLDMFQIGIVDVEEVLKKTDIVDREGLLQRLGEIQRMRGELESVQNENKSLVGLNQTLRRQGQQLEIHLGAQRGLETMRDEVRQTQGEQRLARARMGDAVQNLIANLKVQEKKVMLDGRDVVGRFQIEREKQKALAEVDNARRAAQRPSSGK